MADVCEFKSIASKGNSSDSPPAALISIEKSAKKRVRCFGGLLRLAFLSAGVLVSAHGFFDALESHGLDVGLTSLIDCSIHGNSMKLGILTCSECLGCCRHIRSVSSCCVRTLEIEGYSSGRILLSCSSELEALCASSVQGLHLQWAQRNRWF
jgi:hypothetical protein